MLILTRKIGEAIAINDNITIKVLEIRGGQVKLGIEAPSYVAVHREEIYHKLLEENIRAAAEAPEDLTAVAEALGSKKEKP